MRTTLGPIAIHLAFLLSGFGVLRLLRVTDGVGLGRTVAAAGVAYLAGVVATTTACTVLLVVGVPLSLGMFAVVAALLAAPVLIDLPHARHLRLSRVPGLRSTLRTCTGEQVAAAAALLTFAVVVVVGYTVVGEKPLDQYDAWNLWARKGALLFFDNHLPNEIFRGSIYGNVHPDYPILMPLFEALHLRGSGRLNLEGLHDAFWTMGAAFVAAAAWITARVSRPAVWALVPVAAGLVVINQLLTAYADVPLAFYLCLGVLSLGIWLERGQTADLSLAALLLAGAAMTKNEGLLGALLAFVVAGLVVAATERRRLKLLGLAAAGLMVFAVLPWRVWLAVQGFKGDIPIAKGLDPTFLFSGDRLARVWPSVTALHGTLSSPGTAALFVPLAVALALLHVGRHRRAGIPLYYLGTGMAYTASLVWAYWVSPLEIGFHIATSVSRIYIGVAFIAVAATLHLASFRGVPDPPADTAP